MTVQKILLGAFLAASTFAAVAQSWEGVAVSALLLMGLVSETLAERSSAKTADAIRQLEAGQVIHSDTLLGFTKRLDAVEGKINDPANGLAEQIRVLRNRTGFNK